MINMIFSADQRGAMGYGNHDLIFKSKADMSWFKSNTVGHNCVMGRKTFESMGSKPLPLRSFYVVTRRVTDSDRALMDQWEGRLFFIESMGAMKLIMEENPTIGFWMIGGPTLFNLMEREQIKPDRVLLTEFQTDIRSFNMPNFNPSRVVSYAPNKKYFRNYKMTELFGFTENVDILGRAMMPLRAKVFEFRLTP